MDIFDDIEISKCLYLFSPIFDRIPVPSVTLKEIYGPCPLNIKASRKKIFKRR